MVAGEPVVFDLASLTVAVVHRTPEYVLREDALKGGDHDLAISVWIRDTRVVVDIALATGHGTPAHCPGAHPSTPYPGS